MRLPVLLLDSDSRSAIQLGAQLCHAGFASDIVWTASEALDVLGFRVCSVVNVFADLVDDDECRQCLTDLRHAAPKASMLVITDDPPARDFEIVRDWGAADLMVSPFSVAVLIQYLATHIRLPRMLS